MHAVNINCMHFTLNSLYNSIFKSIIIRKNQLNQQISQANEQVENIQVELTDTLQQIDNLDQKIETYQAEIDEVSKNLEEIFREKTKK